MKKILVLLTVVAIVFCSFSCKTSESAATEPAPAETTAPAEAAPAPAEAAPAEAAPAPQAAVSAEAYEAAILYLQDIDLRAKVPESKKNVEPWTKGVQIFVRKVAPLGDPIEVTVRSYELSLRKADAEMVEVE